MKKGVLFLFKKETVKKILLVLVLFVISVSLSYAADLPPIGNYRRDDPRVIPDQPQSPVTSTRDSYDYQNRVIPFTTGEGRDYQSSVLGQGQRQKPNIFNWRNSQGRDYDPSQDSTRPSFISRYPNLVLIGILILILVIVLRYAFRD